MGRERVSIKNWEMKLIVNIRGMTQQEHARLESIDDILRSETVRQQILPIIERGSRGAGSEERGVNDLGTDSINGFRSRVTD